MSSWREIRLRSLPGEWLGVWCVVLGAKFPMLFEFVEIEVGGGVMGIGTTHIPIQIRQNRG
jgi:hypothetical protein